MAEEQKNTQPTDEEKSVSKTPEEKAETSQEGLTKEEPKTEEAKADETKAEEKKDEPKAEEPSVQSEGATDEKPEEQVGGPAEESTAGADALAAAMEQAHKAVKDEAEMAAPTASDIDPSLANAKIEERNGEKYIKLEDLPEDSVYTQDQMEEMQSWYADTLTELAQGEIVTGKVIAISDKDVTVDVNFKSEGTVPLDEFDDPASLQVGEVIEVFLESVEDSEGQLSLSKKKADFMRVWDRVKKVYETNGIIKGRCVRRIKGGMVVDLGGVDAFLPGSQIDIRPVRDFESLIGEEMEFRILKINDFRKNVVISHKVLVEESLREVREKLLDSLEVGDVLEGTVKNITDFGVFVDLGGVDGLLHITDLSWGRVTHPSEVVQLDQKIKVKVLNYDPERKRISLGLKQLYAYLWDEIDKKYRVEQKVQGRVVSLAKYGAFIEIEPGIEGLVHISEMSWTQHIKHPSQVVNENDYVEVMILNIDKENRKISLGLKQVEEDPWETFEAKYREGTKHKGQVRDLVPFGAFVELEDGIDGLVHISDLSWTRKVRHPSEILKKGQEVEVVVLSFDRDERRIALGLKQLEENPWEAFAREAPMGTRTSGTVTRLIDKGVLVELPYKIEGFVPNSQISRKYYEGKKRNVQLGDVMKLVVIEFDKEERKVVLSNSQAEAKEEEKLTASFKPTTGGSTIGDSLDEDSPLYQALKAAQEEEGGGSKKTPKKAKKEEPKEEPKAEEKKDESEAADEQKEAPKADDKPEETETPSKPTEPVAKSEGETSEEDAKSVEAKTDESPNAEASEEKEEGASEGEEEEKKE